MVDGGGTLMGLLILMDSVEWNLFAIGAGTIGALSLELLLLISEMRFLTMLS